MKKQVIITSNKKILKLKTNKKIDKNLANKIKLNKKVKMNKQTI